MSEMVKWEADGVELSADAEKIRAALNLGNAVKDDEIGLFLALCQARGLNPFIGDAYLIQYGGKAQTVVSQAAMLRRAAQDPDYQGLESGCVVQTADSVIMDSGGIVWPGQTLIGGWARVHRRGWIVPVYVQVSLEEYSQRGGLWKDKPATMVQKVARVHALRQAFPERLGGLYDSDEFAPSEAAPSLQVERERKPSLRYDHDRVIEWVIQTSYTRDQVETVIGNTGDSRGIRQFMVSAGATTMSEGLVALEEALADMYGNEAAEEQPTLVNVNERPH